MVISRPRLPSAIGSLRKLIKAGKASAQSWGQDDVFQAINNLEKAFSDAATKSNAEQWLVNAAVHYNQWVSLQKGDFEPVVAAFRELTDRFRCGNCNGLLYVVPDRGKKESLRCGCNGIGVNLVSKS